MTTPLTAPHSTARPVTRFEIPSPDDFTTLRTSYERAVPSVDRDAVGTMVADGATWDDLVAETARLAPFAFLRYSTLTAQPVFGLAGSGAQCVAYLMGNHTIAARMFRYDPGVLLYAPLRTVLHEAADGTAVLAVDRPSDEFAVFGRPEISAVGRELDAKLARLVDHLGLPVPAELT